MSRVGKSIIKLPAKVEVSIDSANLVTVKGPKGSLTQQLNPGFGISQEESNLTVTRPGDSKQEKALHGLYRALINNMVVGVNEGHTVKQELVGVGYKVSNQGNILDFSLGHSHRIVLEVPKEIQVATETVKGQNPTITMSSMDKQLLGQIAAKIRSFRKPEPYKGKGVRFVGEQLRRKAGKSASK